MNCRECGTAIADKALVCYRCGTAATEAKYKAPAGRRKSPANFIVSVLGLMLLVLFALYMQRMATVGAPAELRWLIIILAAALVALRVIARRTKEKKGR